MRCRHRGRLRTIATVLAISSQVVYGHVGNAAGVFALQRLGHEVWPVPTVLLAHHPGHGAPAGRRFSAEELSALVDGLAARGWLGRIDAVLSGYLGGGEQAEVVASTVARVKRVNPSALYLCDPVLGDAESGLYASPGVAEAMTRLVAKADITTPNLFELHHLAGPPDFSDPVAMARRLGVPCVVTTSAPADPDQIGVLCLVDGAAWQMETPLFRVPEGRMAPKGTGDLFAALLLGTLLTGNGQAASWQARTPRAAAWAAEATSDIFARSVEGGHDELALEALQDRLTVTSVLADPKPLSR